MNTNNNSAAATTEAYWNMLKDLSNEVKLNLIARLSTSMTNPVPDDCHNETKESISIFCGAWQGDETAEEIIAVINEGRRSKSEPIDM